MRVVARMVIVVLMIASSAPLVLAQEGPMGGPGPAMSEGAKKEFAPEQSPEVKAEYSRCSMSERQGSIKRGRAWKRRRTTTI
jgi:hypothetical protein